MTRLIYRQLSFLMMVAVLAMGSNAVAGMGADHEDMHHEASGIKSLDDIQANPSRGEDGRIHLNNKFCPVSGDEVSGKRTVVINDVVYNTCCKQCVKKMKNNPGKYAYTENVVNEALGAGVKESVHSHGSHDH